MRPTALIEAFQIWWRGYSAADIDTLRAKMAITDPNRIVWLSNRETAALRAGEWRDPPWTPKNRLGDIVEQVEREIAAINRFRGMSYSQASREAARLIECAHKSGNWFGLVDQLSELRSIMRREMAAGRSSEAA